MKEMRCAVIMVAVLIFAAAIFLVRGETTHAQQCQVIRIYASMETPTPSARLEPETLSIDKGDCVVWLNWGRDNVQVKFREGKKCEEVTEPPTGFKLDAENCYVTDFLPLGATSSLKFNEAGTYAYEVTWEGRKDLVEKGKVIVRAPQVKKQKE